MEPKGMVFLICLHLLCSKRLFTYTGAHYSQWQPFESFIRGIFNWTLANALQTNGPQQAWECVCVCKCVSEIFIVCVVAVWMWTLYALDTSPHGRWQAVSRGSVWFSQRKSSPLNLLLYVVHMWTFFEQSFFTLFNTSFMFACASVDCTVSNNCGLPAE